MASIRNLSESIILCYKFGDLTNNREKVSLFQIIEQIKKSCLLTTKVTLRLLIQEDVYINANRSCILQLFQNLLTNAVRYSTGQEIIITVNGKQDQNGLYEVTIHNNGIFPKSFIKMYHSQSLDKALTGTGIGLIICKRIITAYNGNMRIDSSAKNGTTISLMLPTE
jgi:signal transduction histidine kinase